MQVRRVLIVASLAFAAVAVAGLEVQQHRISALQQDAAQMALHDDSLHAALDSTRVVSRTNAAVAAAVGESLTVTQRQVVQVAQQADAVDKALKLERRGRYALALTVDSLHRTVASRGPVTEDSTSSDNSGNRAGIVRRASFDVREAPYTVAANVEMPAPPGTARLELSIRLDSIRAVARLSCAAPNAHGIRAASIEAETPQWAAVAFTHVEQSPDLCASPALTKAPRRSLLKFKPLMIGGGRVIEPDGTSRWGAFIGAGFAIGST